jgi:hypothetical protein
VPGDLRFTAVGNACGTTAAGALYCWNGTVDTTMFDAAGVVLDECQFGSRSMRFTVPCSPAPVRLRTPVAMARPARESRDCALDAAGAAYCWGDARSTYGWRGLMPRDTTYGRLPPERLEFPVPLVALFGNTYPGPCGSTASGAVYCRGTGWYGLFGNGPASDPPGDAVLVAGGTRFVSVASAVVHMCGVTADGAVQCWGADASGQLGVGRAYLETCAPQYYIAPQPCLTRPRRIASIAGR